MWTVHVIRAMQHLIAHQAYNNKPHPPHTVEDWLEIGGGVLAIVLLIAIVKIAASIVGADETCPSCDDEVIRFVKDMPAEQLERVRERLRKSPTHKPHLRGAVYCKACGRVWDDHFYGIRNRSRQGWHFPGQTRVSKYDQNRFECRRCNGWVWQEGMADAHTLVEQNALEEVKNPRYVCEKCGTEHAWQVDDVSAMVFFDPVDDKQ